MNGAVLRTELRRSVAPWALLVLTVLTLGVGFGLSGPWTHGTGAWDEQWQGLAQWQRELLMFGWPVVVALGAWQGSRQHRSGIDDLLDSTPRPAWQRSAVLAAVVCAGLAAACVLVLVVGAVRVQAGPLSLDWLPTFAVGVLAVCAGGLLGMGLGNLLPYLVTPPVLAVAGLVLVALLHPSSMSADVPGPFPLRLDLLSPALSGPSNAYTTVAGSVHIGQTVWFLGLAVTGALLLSVRGVRARLFSALPVLLAGALALSLLPDRVALAYPFDADAAAPVCDEQGPRVCVTAAHRDLLPGFTGPARQALAALSVLPNAPTSVREVPDVPYRLYAPLPRPADTLLVDLNERDTRVWGGRGLGAEALRSSLPAGAGTQPCGGYALAGELCDRETAARTITVSWFLGDRLLPPQPRGYDDQIARALFTGLTVPAWERFHALPRAEQVRRMAAVREAGLTCRGDQLALLAGATP